MVRVESILHNTVPLYMDISFDVARCARQLISNHPVRCLISDHRCLTIDLSLALQLGMIYVVDYCLPGQLLGGCFTIAYCHFCSGLLLHHCCFLTSFLLHYCPSCFINSISNHCYHLLVIVSVAHSNLQMVFHVTINPL